jgi:hypothetical protein
MPTATSRRAAEAAAAKAAGGTLAPSSRQSKPSSRTRSATMAMGRLCSSPSGAPNTTVPRLRPGRRNRAPSRATRRMAVAVAR